LVPDTKYLLVLKAVVSLINALDEDVYKFLVALFDKYSAVNISDEVSMSSYIHSLREIYKYRDMISCILRSHSASLSAHRAPGAAMLVAANWLRKAIEASVAETDIPTWLGVAAAFAVFDQSLESYWDR
jgi:hypothetical protein